MKHVAVIGGGFAGLASALALAASGCRVTLLEARAGIGGKARAVPARGASVDVGPSILDDVAPLAALADRAGLTVDDIVPVDRLHPGLVATFPDGVSLTWDMAHGRLHESLRRLGSTALRDWERVAAVGEDAVALTRHFLARGDVAPREIVPSLLRGDAGPLWAAARFLGGGGRLSSTAAFVRHRSLADLLTATVETPALRAVLGHFARFVGLDATTAPSVLVVIGYRLAARGVWYPRGGFAALAGSLASMARKHGTEIMRETPVMGLDVRDGRVTAVQTVAGGIAVDACIAALDVGRVAAWLPSHPLARRVAALQPSATARVAWWVIDGPPPTPVHHALHFVDGVEPVYVAMPTVSDPALAPGHTIVQAVLHEPAHAARTTTEIDLGLLDAVARRLIARGVWPRGRVVASGTAGDGTPCYGYAIKPGLFGGFRPAQRLRDLPNLVLAGGSVFPGPGVSSTLRSGLRAADLVLETLA